MQDRKEYILQKAFEVFMTKGYDSVSMTVLQQELKMSRGAMYRYFESKDALFNAVIDKYFFGLVNYMRPIQKRNITLAEKIENSCRNLKKLSKYLDNIIDIKVVFLNYTALIIQAAKRYPDFTDIMKSVLQEDQKNWRQTLEYSKKIGEIREDVNVKIMAQVFSKAVNAGGDADSPEKSFSTKVEESQKILMYLYSLIKA